MRIDQLPVDIQDIIFAACTPLALAIFSRTSRENHQISLRDGWRAWRHRHLPHSLTASHRITASLLPPWRPRTTPLHTHVDHSNFSLRVDHAWNERRINLDTMRIHYPKRALPVLLLHAKSRRLYLGAGIQLFVIAFSDQGAPIPSKPCFLATSAVDDITGIATASNTSDEIIVSHLSGRIRRLRITLRFPHSHRRTTPGAFSEIQWVEVARYDHPQTAKIQSIHASGDLFASVAISSPAARQKAGFISLYHARSPWLPASRARLPGRPWTVHFTHSASTTSSSSWIAAGHSGPTPSSLFHLTESGISQDPIHLLSGGTSSSPAYAFAVDNSNPHLLYAGMYDGLVRIYDLRDPSNGGAQGINPTIHLSEPFSDSAIYSLAIGGGHGAHVFAGSARHSLVRAFDVRFPKATAVHSFSLFVGRGASPVFGLAAEQSRVFGVLEERAFMLETDPKVNGSSQAPVRYYEHSAPGVLKVAGEDPKAVGRKRTC